MGREGVGGGERVRVRAREERVELEWTERESGVGGGEWGARLCEGGGVLRGRVVVERRGG